MTAPAQSDQTSEDDNETTVSELDVIAGRDYAHQTGAVVGVVKPEVQYSAAQVQAFGVGTVTELLGELEFQTRTERESGGGGPLVLLNGRRIASLNEVNDLPTEAILRVDVLPEEASLQYGLAPTQRVLNIVLRRHFRAALGSIDGGRSDGGRVLGQAEAGLLHLHHDRRLNFDLKYAASDDVTDADLGVREFPSADRFALGGNVLSPVAGGEIDPALSALAGAPVTIAGVPVLPGGAAPTLADFVATAGRPNVTNVGRFRTLTPSVESLTANAVLAQPLAGGVNVTINAAFSARSSDSLHGLSSLKLLVPQGDPFSPFATDVQVDRYVDQVRHQYVNGWTGHLGAVLDKETRSWRYSLTGRYDHADTQTDTESGVDKAPLQALLDARSPLFNPFGTLEGVSIPVRRQRTARSISDLADLQGLATGPVLKLPAGSMTASVRLGDAQAWQSSTSAVPAAFPSISLSQNNASGQVNLEAPLASRTNRVLAFAGDLSVHGNYALSRVSGFGTLHGFGYGLTWTPAPALSLIASYSDREAAPTVEQLGAAALSTSDIRLFDFSRGQSVEVAQITGGNPDLTYEKRRTLKLGFTVRPFSRQDLTVTLNYIKADIRNPIFIIPAVTSEFEAAFPDRFDRDASGGLTLEDDRPLNLARLQRSEIRWGFNFSRHIGATSEAASPLAGLPKIVKAAPDSTHSADETDRQSEAGKAGGGRKFRAPPRPASGARIQFALYHSVYLTDRETLRPGAAPLDLLNGAPATFTGGQYANEVDAQLGVVSHGFGARLTGFWRQGTTVHSVLGPPGGDLRFSGLTVVNLRLFDNFTQQKAFVEKHPWLRGARLSVNITNLFDQRVSARDRTGAVPLVYEPGYVDPIGRTITVTFRKLFR